MRKKIEERLIKLSASIIESISYSNKNYASEYLFNQLTRSICSAALNYGEVQGAQSNKDFIHKLSIVIKELRESLINLKILQSTKLSKHDLSQFINECDQLISIFYKSLKTAKNKEIINKSKNT